jgi:hypothetical protein
MTRANSLKNGGSDGARTRDLRRDSPAPRMGMGTCGMQMGVDQTSYPLIAKSATWTAPARKLGRTAVSRSGPSRSYLVFFPYCSWGSGPVATKSHLNNLHVLGQGEPQFDRAND